MGRISPANAPDAQTPHTGLPARVTALWRPHPRRLRISTVTAVTPGSLRHTVPKWIFVGVIDRS
ncbi:hypothetical protein KRMM14A1259_28410 [Krasilnikovia sp. MM14-A1259]